MNKLLAAAAIAAGLMVAGAAAAAPNLVVNGDFSAGNTGFTSGYTFVPYGADMHPEGLYTVGSNPFAVHSSWIDLQDGNSRMIVNGATQAPLPFVWREDIAGVSAGTYAYSLDVANICCNASYDGPNLASLLTFEFSTDGVNYNPIDGFMTSPPGDAGQFTTLSGTFNVATSGTLRLNIGSGTDFFGGNDFAIDNISVSAAGVPEPASWALMIGGMGLAGAAMRRRRAQAAVA